MHTYIAFNGLGINGLGIQSHYYLSVVQDATHTLSQVHSFKR